MRSVDMQNSPGELEAIRFQFQTLAPEPRYSPGSRSVKKDARNRIVEVGSSRDFRLPFACASIHYAVH